MHDVGVRKADITIIRITIPIDITVSSHRLRQSLEGTFNVGHCLAARRARRDNLMPGSSDKLTNGNDSETIERIPRSSAQMQRRHRTIALRGLEIF